ncbi:MAG TPA: F420-dependent oxidoreductase, partial [Acidimicrobiales bacterium]|nr:F420-dependent oxidoreductase [Acidimicrobiales bacterium]
MNRRLRAMLILTENVPLVPPGDVGALVDMAVTAERAGVHSVMLSDHVCLGPEA